MQATKLLKRFETYLVVWEQALDQYTEEEFLRQPDADSWSIGQVYIHLAGTANYYHLKQMELCLQDTNNTKASKTTPGKVSYFLGFMPPVRIKVPASPEYTPPQPANKAAVKEKLQALRVRMAKAADALNGFTGQSGKTKHPSLGYLNASEWYQLIQMHFRHHLRQKARLDIFLNK
jgi:hypothetical protein